MNPSAEMKEHFKRELHDLVSDLDTFHKQLKKLTNRLENLEKEAQESGLERVELALRDAYVKMSNAGASLVEAHLDLGVPPTVFQPDHEEERGKRKKRAQPARPRRVDD